MRHFYSEIDSISLTFCDIVENKDGMEMINLHFERPIEGGFDFLDSTLPVLVPEKSYGFSELEIERLLRYARNNAPLIWDIAREDGE